MSFRAIASVIAMMTACSFAAGPTAAQQIKLTFADQNSPTAWGPTRALYPWVKQLEEATKGRIKVEVYPSQTLVKGVDMWKAASAGTIDIGWCVQSYWSDLTPLSDVVSLPGLPAGVSAEKLSEVLWKLYEKYPAIQKEYDSANVQPLALYTTASYFIASARKQVKTLEDMQGLKIRTVGGPAVAYLVPYRPAGTRLRVPRPEHDTSDPGQHQGSRTHDAGLEGDHQRAVLESPASVRRGGGAQGQDLGMGGRVAVRLTLVVPGTEHLPLRGEHHGAHRDVARVERAPGDLEGLPHPDGIPLRAGWRVRGF